MDYDANLVERVTKLENDVKEIRERLVRIETRLDECATKADLQALETRLIKWYLVTSLSLVGIVVAINHYMR